MRDPAASKGTETPELDPAEPANRRPSVAAGIESLYDIAVRDGRATSSRRLEALAAAGVAALAARGHPGAETEAVVEGIGREKKWDLVWRHHGRARLGISLKSLLRNIPGTVPNRLDEVMGEVANVQLYSPEIVVGYVVVFDRSQDSWSEKHGSTWLEHLRSRLEVLTGRGAPSWATGTLEALVLAEVDFSQSPALLSPPGDFETFFDRLAAQVRLRNPGATE